MALSDLMNTADVPMPDSLATTSPAYQLTQQYVDPDTGRIYESLGQAKKVKLYNGTGGAIVKGQVCMLAEDGDEETSLKVITLAAAAMGRDLVVAEAALADATWGWFFVSGYCEALVEGTTDVTKDDYLIGASATSTTGFVDVGTTKTAAAAAIACESQTDNSNVLTKILLFGGVHVVT